MRALTRGPSITAAVSSMKNKMHTIASDHVVSKTIQAIVGVVNLATSSCLVITFIDSKPTMVTTSVQQLPLAAAALFTYGPSPELGLRPSEHRYRRLPPLPWLFFPKGIGAGLWRRSP